MKFALVIRCDNAAFAEEPGTEVARILRSIAEEIEGQDLIPMTGDSVRDVNGNRVGAYSITD